MADDDDLWAQLYGEAPPEEDEPKPAPVAPPPPLPPPPPAAPATDAETGAGSPPPPAPDDDAGAPDNDDDDDDDLQIVLDAPAGGAYPEAGVAGEDDDDDDFDVQLDEDAVASAVPTRGADGEPAPGTAPPPPSPPGGPNVSNAFPGPPPPPTGVPGRAKPALPKYAVNNDLPPALPSEAAPGQRVRLPGQSRVTPEEYREFLGLGHGEIFNLDIDLVVDAPWYMPGIDITDFFNYDLTPDTWKEYCAVVHQFRVEFSMQKKISTMGGAMLAPPVFVDPDLPPELRAAVAAQRMGGAPRPPAPFAHGMPGHVPHPGYAAPGGVKVEHAPQPLPPGVGPAPIATQGGPRPPTAPHPHAYGPPGAAHGMSMYGGPPGMGMRGPRPPYGGPHQGMMAPRPMMQPGAYPGVPPGMPMQAQYAGMYGAPQYQFVGQQQHGGVRPPYGHPAPPPPQFAAPPPHQPTAPPPPDPPRRARPDVCSLAMGMDVGIRRREDDRRRRDDDRDRRSRRSRSRSRERSRRY